MNVVSVDGIENMERQRYIKNMKPGEVGYTVPWAYDESEHEINENYTLSRKGGTASLLVMCVAKGKYSLRFERSGYAL